MQPSFLALLLFQLLFMGNVIYLGEFLIRKEISLFLTSNSKNFLTLHQFCAAFYHQRVKLKDGALWELLQIFNQKLQPTLYRERYRLVACDGSVADIFRDEKIQKLILNQTINLPEVLIRSISMHFILS